MNTGFRAVLLLFILSAYCMTAQARDGWVPVRSEGPTTLSVHAHGVSIVVKIITHEINNGVPRAPSWLSLALGCTTTRYPCHFTEKLSIKVNGRSIYIPGSVTCGLEDLDDARLKTVNHGGMLILRGGDTSESYIAKISFNSVRVKRKDIYSPMEPSFLLEETVYHLLVVK